MTVPARLLVPLGILTLLAGAVYATLPPLATTLDAPPTPSPLVRGAIHIHTDRSDGTGTVDEVAAAAARAGLAFIILTDHGDATREPLRPSYRSGVLCIDAVEISTTGGHLVALGLAAAPYPLGGEPRDVVEDVARLRGMSIAAHPGSPKPDLRWSDWSTPVDGLEWMNGDSEWRDETMASLMLAFARYPFRRVETLGSLLGRPSAVIQQWDALAQRRPVVALAAADAHARLGLRGTGDPYDSAATLDIPGYEQVFRAFSITLPQARLSRDAAADARIIIEEIRKGHLYSSVEAFAHPAVMSFSATSGRASAVAGETLIASGPTTLTATTNAPADSTLTLFKNGEATLTGTGPTLEHVVSAEPAAYRVEATLAGGAGRAPWVVSNPIYIGARRTPVPAPPRAPRDVFTRWGGGSSAEWAIEHSDRGIGAVDVVGAAGGGEQLLFRYALGGVAGDASYVALSLPAGPTLAMYDRIVFTARADHPMRLVVQARVPEGQVGERWHRSVYLDDMPREITVTFDDMTPLGPTSAAKPILSRVNALLFVVDSLNTKLGSSGQVFIDELRYAR